ncbi:DNA-formamidopyrimidine glycosylase family protein, partial [Pediococcus pentosaceus]
MPELPEVETVRRGLAALVEGKIVTNVVVPLFKKWSHQKRKFL